jgi:hypothetical protein
LNSISVARRKYLAAAEIHLDLCTLPGAQATLIMVLRTMRLRIFVFRFCALKRSAARTAAFRLGGQHPPHSPRRRGSSRAAVVTRRGSAAALERDSFKWKPVEAPVTL